MLQTDPTLSIHELAEATGVSPRTVRYYVRLGLLPAPKVPGRGPRYSEVHVALLSLILRLRGQGFALGEIQRRLDGLSFRDVWEAVRRLERTSGEVQTGPERIFAGGLPRREKPRGPANEEREARILSERSQWERYELVPGMELHVRKPVTKFVSQRIARLLQVARRLLEEEGG